MKNLKEVKWEWARSHRSRQSPQLTEVEIMSDRAPSHWKMGSVLCWQRRECMGAGGVGMKRMLPAPDKQESADRYPRQRCSSPVSGSGLFSQETIEGDVEEKGFFFYPTKARNKPLIWTHQFLQIWRRHLLACFPYPISGSTWCFCM